LQAACIKFSKVTNAGSLDSVVPQNGLVKAQKALHAHTALTAIAAARFLQAWVVFRAMQRELGDWSW
jgi:hypothetical protein